MLVLIKLVRLVDFDSEGTNIKEFENLLKSGKLIFVKGWGYRNKELTKVHREYYRDLFYKGFHPPAVSVLNNGLINVAVHIRRGDYIHWQEGKYYFGDEVYLGAIKQMRGLLGKPLNILIFHNDSNLNRGLYKKECDSIYFSDNDEKTDHYLMGLCNYIIGPPSSFSMWASYIGQTKYLHLQGQGSQFSLEDFSVCDG